MEVSYPIGHRVRREEGIPVLKQKFNNSMAGVFDREQMVEIVESFSDADKLNEMRVCDFMDLFVVNEKGMQLA